MSYRSPIRRQRQISPHLVRRLSPTMRRAALARALAPAPRRRGPGALIAGIALLGVLTIVIASSAAMGAAGVIGYAALQEGLPDPARLEQLEFAQPTIVYDRTGKIELARFQSERRRVVGFEQIPRLVLDATTVVEDRTFWQNEGFDSAAIAAAILENARGDSERGASTITQQLVRARLLPPELLKPGADRYIRKAKELLQAQRVTAAFPGERGKERIITAYLNQIFYGHNAYGVAAAADVYFGVKDLADLTPAQAALLAGLPKSPATLDPYRWAEATEDGKLIVPRSAPPVIRRDYILRGLRAGGRWTKLSESELRAALREPVVLIGERPLVYKAPHFVWAVKRQLDSLLADREPVERGGYRVITSLDWEAQQLGEKFVRAGAILPNVPLASMRRSIKRNKLERDEAWISRLRGRDVHNAALGAIDYRSGDVLAYVGSAGYYRDDLASEEFDPKYDVAGVGYRQPGSSFKPIVYATGFERRTITPATVLIDATTEFARDWTPRDADRRERGPVRVRKALQYSLNIPALKAMNRIGPDAVAEESPGLGLHYANGALSMIQAGMAGGIGTVEVRLTELVSAYGTLANSGVHVPPRMILEIDGPDGAPVYRAGRGERTRAISPQAAYLITDILKGNTDPAENIFWGPELQVLNGPNGERRPAAVKTGTTNDTRDLATYGYLAPPADRKAPALAVGVWMGNSDHSQPQGDEATFALDGPARIWHAFIRDYWAGRPVADFERPNGIVEATTDAWSGGAPGPWTRDTVQELYIRGTEPGALRAIDEPGILYTFECGTWRVDPAAAEPVQAEPWQEAVASWTARARTGPGVVGEFGTATTYFWGESDWGGPIAGPCEPKPDPSPSADPSAAPSSSASGGPGGGPGASPGPAPTPRPKPSKPPKPRP